MGRGRARSSGHDPRVAEATSERRRSGPVDPRVLGLSPALRRHLVVTSVLAALVAAAVLLQAEAIARYLPRLIDGDADAVRPLAAWLVVAGLARALAAGASDWSATVAVTATRTTVRRRVLDRVVGLRADRRHDLGPATASALTTTSSDALEPWIRSYLPGLSLAVAVPLVSGLRILGADVISAVILAVVVPLVPIFMILIGLATESQAAKQWEALSRLAARFLDVLTGLPTLRLFGRADAQVSRVREVTDRYRQATMKTLRVAFLSALVLELLATLSVALVAVSLGGRLAHGDVGLSTALLVLLLTPECLLPIRRVSAAFHAATSGVDAAAEIGEALDLPLRPEGDRPLPAGVPLAATGVSVRDPDRGRRLAPVDLVVAPGELVALSGPSGAGKSTLLDVLRGALVPDAGTVAVGDVPVGDLDATARAAAIRWVPQRAQALGADVRSSVALGHGQGSAVDAAVDRALAQYGLTALAHLHPSAVSGGERRRVALARAQVGVLLGTVAFLLLDEPTAQLDAHAAERVLAAALEARRRGVGLVVATHDPAVEAAADRMVRITAGGGDGGELPEPETAPPPIHLRTDTALVPDPVAGWAAEVGADRTDDGRGALRWLLGTARHQRWRLAGATALGILTDACTVGLAATAAWLIVRAAEQPSFADLAVAAVAVRAFALGKGPLRYAERLTSHDTTLRLLAELRATVIARLARLAPNGLPRGARGDLLARMVDDIDRLQDFFLRVLGPAASSLTIGIGAATVATVLDPAGGGALLVTVVVVGALLPHLTFLAARRRGASVARLRGEIGTDVVDLAEHAEELVACGADRAWRDRIEQAAAELDRADHRQGRPAAAIAACVAAAPALATAAMVATTGPAGPGLSGPELGVLVLLPLVVVDLVGPLAAAGEALARVEASASRVLALLRRPDPVPEPASPAPLPAGADLALDGVAVGWPGGPLQVDGIDLRVSEGGRAVITGPSGSGKSTIAALLVGFLPPARGRYRVGGTAADELGGDAVRRRVTWCQQDPWFADSTLADNLRIAAPDAGDDELHAALDVAHLGDWARGLPDGLETRLARDAATLSGGERQRLALARALLGGQRAVVLDEPTSHLDAANARVVMRDLLAATADRAVVVIAHGDAAEALGPVHHLDPTDDGPSRWRPPG